MRRIFLLVSVSFLPTLLFAAAKPFPPPPASYVYNENVISPQAANGLSQELAHFEQTTHHQFVVALFQNLDGEDVDDYANRLFHYWKIGDAKRNDGLLFCVFKADRRWRVEVGYGLEPVLTDLEASEIVQRSALPYFKQGDFDQGVLTAASSLIGKLSSNLNAPIQNSKSKSAPIPLNAIAYLILIAIWAWLNSRRAATIGRRYGRSGNGYSNWGIMGGGLGGGWGGSGGFGGGGGFMGGGGMSGGGGASGGW